MNKPIEVSYKWTDNLDTIRSWIEQDLKDIDIIACDFEVSSKYSKEYLEEVRTNLETETDWEKKRILERTLATTGLSHPSLTELTHLSIAWSNHQAMVFIILDHGIRDYLLDFLVETDKKEIWHNLGFDGKFLLYYKHKLPRNWEDTLLMAKAYMNHAKNYKCEVGLKALEGHNYGEWAISKENFNLDEVYKEYMLKYSATDACATYNLYMEIIES
mgnify:CR=1 FL=1